MHVSAANDEIPAMPQRQTDARASVQLTHLLTPVTVASQVLDSHFQRVCAGICLLLQQLKLGGMDLRQADALSLHLQPALTLNTGRKLSHSTWTIKLGKASFHINIIIRFFNMNKWMTVI